MRVSTRQDWLAAASVLAALAAVFALPAATSGTSFARAIAAMALAALVSLAVARAPLTFAIRVRTGIVLLVVLALWYVVTRLWAVDPGGSMAVGARLCAFVLLAWAVHTCVLGVGARRLLLLGVTACALAASAGPLRDVVSAGGLDGRVHGMLDYWNATAIVAVILVPVAVALAGTGRRRNIAIAALLVPLAGVAAAATASRGAILALGFALLIQALLDPDHRGGLPRAFVAAAAFILTIAALAIDGVPVVIALLSPALVAAGGFGVIRARRERHTTRVAASAPALELVDPLSDSDPAPESVPQQPRGAGKHVLRHPRIVRAFGALLVVCLAALLILLVANSETSSDRAAPDPALVDAPASDPGDVTRLTSTDDSERFNWYREALELWRDRPIIGHGGDAFDTLRVDIPGRYVQHVHSMPLEVLLEAGIIGALLLAAATILLLRVLRLGHRSADRALAAAICALILVQSLIDWTLSIPHIAILLAVAGPIALVSPPDPREHPADAASTADIPTWAAATMLVALAAATTVSFMPVLASLLADQAAHEIDAGEPAAATRLARESMLLVPALDTLTLQVISLQMAGDEDGVREALNANEQVWLHRSDGLRLAAPYFIGDPERTKDIERRIQRMEQELEAARLGPAPE